MRKPIITILFFGIFLTACQNQSGKQKEIEIENTGEINSESVQLLLNDAAKKPGAREFLYKSDNGEIVSVAFYEENYEKHVGINREGQGTLILDQISTSEKTTVYEKDIYRFTSQNDQATFTNGINYLKLALISPMKYTFINGEEDIMITYFTKDDKRFVTIQRNGKPEITLEQTNSRAKGAEYGKGPIQWHTQNDMGILIENGTETEFNVKK